MKSPGSDVLYTAESASTLIICKPEPINTIGTTDIDASSDKELLEVKREIMMDSPIIKQEPLSNDESEEPSADSKPFKLPVKMENLDTHNNYGDPSIMQQTCNLDSTPSNRELKILDVCHIKEELTEVESVNAAHIKSEFGQTVKSINTESIDSEGFDSSNGAKLVRKRKFGCPFCKKLVRDISCHIRRCHVKEEEVQRALSKSTTSVERKRLLTMMRIRGMKAVGITQESRTDHVRCLFCGDSVFQFQDHCLKTHSSEPEVERIVHSKDDEASKRRKFRALRDRCLRIPQTTKVKCIHCGLLHSKRTLVKHIKNCSFRDKSETLDLRTVRKSCMTVTIHDSLDPRYRCLSVILGNTRQDDVTQIILNDRYLLELGKALIEMDIAAGKTPSDRLILKLRCLAKFLQTANKISSGALKSFRDVYIVSNYKYFKSSVIFMGDYVAETRSFSKPTLPLYVGSLVLHSSSTLRSILVKEGDTAAAQEVIRWKKLYRRDFSNSIKKLINKDLEFDHQHFLSNDDSLTTESGGKSSNESDCKIKITNISTLSTEDSSNFNQIKEDQMSNAGYIKLMDSGTSYSINASNADIFLRVSDDELILSMRDTDGERRRVVIMFSGTKTDAKDFLIRNLESDIILNLQPKVKSCRDQYVQTMEYKDDSENPAGSIDDLPDINVGLLNETSFIKELVVNKTEELDQDSMETYENQVEHSPYNQDLNENDGQMDDVCNKQFLADSLEESSTFQSAQDTLPEQVERKGRTYCIFCKNLVLHFARHLQNNHAEEFVVSEFIKLPPNDRGRKGIIEDIRKEGIREFAKNNDFTKFLVKRKCTKKDVTYLPCLHCKGLYHSRTLSKHYKICTGQSSAPRNLSKQAHTVLHCKSLKRRYK